MTRSSLVHRPPLTAFVKDDEVQRRPTVAPVPIAWPNGKDFAFTIVDDTDGSTMENVPPVYALLADLGFRTTKSIWVLDGDPRAGLACDDRRYRDWAVGLQEQGFEIALHNVSSVTSSRERTIQGLDRFRDIFGADPAVHVNHDRCGENMYWGSARVSGMNRRVYDALNRQASGIPFAGHVESSPLSSRAFWET